jgi:hypothetical protein
LSDAGVYSVTVENVAGSAVTNATLTVSEPTLNHRWSFTGEANNSTNVIDSIGGANGTLEGNAYISNGAVQLPDTTTTSSSANASFVLFPNGLLVGDNSATIEVWATDLGGREWAELWCFGGNTSFYDNVENGSNYLALIPHDNSDVMRSDFNIDGGPTVSVAAESPLPLGVEEDIALTYDNTTAIASLYLNGSLVAQRINMTANGPASPAELGNTYDNYLGRDQFGGDPIFQGSVKELRIYDGPLTPTDIANDYIAGPATVTSPGTANRVAVGISKVGTNVVLTWPTGILLQSTNVSGPWTVNSEATSPYTVPASNGPKFYIIQVYPEGVSPY